MLLKYFAKEVVHLAMNNMTCVRKRSQECLNSRVPVLLLPKTSCWMVSRVFPR